MSHTQIPNELMEILMSNALSKHEARVLLYIARQTHGYHRKTDRISKRQFNEKLRISIRGLTDILSRLELVKLISLVNKGNSRLFSSEWTIDTSNYTEKLVKLASLDKLGSNARSRLVKHISKTGEARLSKIASLNKPIKETSNVNSIIDKLVDLLGDKGKIVDGKAYRLLKGEWKVIEHPAGYLKKIEESSQVPQSPEKGGISAEAYNNYQRNQGIEK